MQVCYFFAKIEIRKFVIFTGLVLENFLPPFAYLSNYFNENVRSCTVGNGESKNLHEHNLSPTEFLDSLHEGGGANRVKGCLAVLTFVANFLLSVTCKYLRCKDFSYSTRFFIRNWFIRN